MCDHTVWDAQIEALTDIADARVVEWGMQHTTLVEMAQAALAAAPQRFALAGHSMGGRVAFEVYRLAPERVTHIAVMNTGVIPRAEGEAGEEEARGRRHLLDIAFQQGIRAMAMEWMKGMVPEHRRGDAVLVDAIVGMFERKTPELFLVQQQALLARRDARPVLETIQCPALVLTGGDDAWSPPAAHEKIAAGIAGSQLVIVPRSGHMSTMEQPTAVSAAMRSWLSGSR